jgi:transcriptional regulator with XRE-family HTH domain
MADFSKILTLCESMNIPLSRLARDINISYSGLKRIIDDNSTRTDTLEKIAKYLGVEVAYFFSNDPNNGIYFSDSDFVRIESMIDLSGLQKYKEEILNSFCFYDTKGKFISKHGIISEVFARFEQKLSFEKQLAEREKLISSFQKSIDMLHDKKSAQTGK